MTTTKLHTYINKGRGKKTGAYPHSDKTGSNKSKMSGFNQHPGYDAVLGGKRKTGGYGMKGGKPVDTARKQDE